MVLIKLKHPTAKKNDIAKARVPDADVKTILVFIFEKTDANIYKLGTKNGPLCRSSVILLVQPYFPVLLTNLSISVCLLQIAQYRQQILDCASMGVYAFVFSL